MVAALKGATCPECGSPDRVRVCLAGKPVGTPCVIKDGKPAEDDQGHCVGCTRRESIEAMVPDQCPRCGSIGPLICDTSRGVVVEAVRRMNTMVTELHAMLEREECREWRDQWAAMVELLRAFFQQRAIALQVSDISKKMRAQDARMTAITGDLHKLSRKIAGEELTDEPH